MGPLLIHLGEQVKVHTPHNFSPSVSVLRATIVFQCTSLKIEEQCLCQRIYVCPVCMLYVYALQSYAHIALTT